MDSSLSQGIYVELDDRSTVMEGKENRDAYVDGEMERLMLKLKRVLWISGCPSAFGGPNGTLPKILVYLGAAVNAFCGISTLSFSPMWITMKGFMEPIMIVPHILCSLIPISAFLFNMVASRRNAIPRLLNKLLIETKIDLNIPNLNAKIGRRLIGAIAIFLIYFIHFIIHQFTFVAGNTNFFLSPDLLGPIWGRIFMMGSYMMPYMFIFSGIASISFWLTVTAIIEQYIEDFVRQYLSGNHVFVKQAGIVHRNLFLVIKDILSWFQWNLIPSLALSVLSLLSMVVAVIMNQLKTLDSDGMQVYTMFLDSSLTYGVGYCICILFVARVSQMAGNVIRSANDLLVTSNLEEEPTSETLQLESLHRFVLYLRNAYGQNGVELFSVSITPVTVYRFIAVALPAIVAMAQKLLAG